MAAEDQTDGDEVMSPMIDEVVNYGFLPFLACMALCILLFLGMPIVMMLMGKYIDWLDDLF